METIRQRSGVRRGRGHAVTPRDIALVAWIASHRFVLAAQVQAWLGAGRVVAYRRLQALVSLGLLRHERIFHAQPGVYLATNGGIALCGSPLPRARVDLRCYRHDLGVVWLALALAREWGGGDASNWLVTEREMRSADGRGDGPSAGGRFAVALAGTTDSGQGRLHYPDLVLVDGAGRRVVAVELELSAKGPRRLERILAGYVRDRSIERVIYFTERSSVCTGVLHAGRRVGAEHVLELGDFDETALRQAALAKTEHQIDTEVDQ